jgi:hypothetical protein
MAVAVLSEEIIYTRIYHIIFQKTIILLSSAGVVSFRFTCSIPGVLEE